jgi:PKD repeat protein
MLVSVNENGCPNDTAIGNIIVFPVPDAAFEFQKADTCGVPMDVQMINQTSGAIDYSWDFGDGQISDLLSPIHTYLDDGTFTITLIGGNIYSCYDTSFATVSVYLQPLADFYIPSDKICQRDTLIVENNSLDAVSYCWRLGNEIFSMNEDLIIIPEVPGVIPVTLIAKYNEFCQDSISLPAGLEVFITPTAEFEYMADPQVNILGDVQFTNLSIDYEQLGWNFGDGTFSTDESPLHEYNINRDISVTLTATHFNGGELTCVDSTTQSIAPEWLITFYAPNAFSPDHGDSLISVFKPVGIGLAEYKIEVYSPWGQRVWHSDRVVDQKPVESWNGRIENQGDILPQGAFSWIARIKFVNGENRVYKGSVSLLR